MFSQYTLAKVTWRVPVSSSALLSEWPIREPFHCDWCQYRFGEDEGMRRAYVVVHVDVGDGDPVSSVGDVEETVVEVLVGVEVANELHVVDPHVLRVVDAHGVTVVGVDLADLEVTDDDVVDTTNVEANTSQG
jgi:hypothetical protein